MSFFCYSVYIIHDKTDYRIHSMFCFHQVFLEYMKNSWSMEYSQYRVSVSVRFDASWLPCTSKQRFTLLTHWGRVTHMCVSKLSIMGSDNGLSPDRRQAIIWTNAGILLFRTLGIKFSRIVSEIHTFSFKKCIWKCRLRNGGHFVSASMC